MNRLAPYANSLWLTEPDRFQRCINLAMQRNCPSARDVAEWRGELMAIASTLPAGGIPSTGINQPEERAEVKQVRAIKGKVGVIPIHGPIGQHATSELMKAEGTPTDFVSKAIDVMLGNSSIGAIVLHIDSPGGSVYGVQELSDKIYKSRGDKPIYAIADSEAASAAYWIGSAADMLVVTHGGVVGSVGVYVMHMDVGDAMKAEGVKVSVVQAGKYKTEFSPYGPLSDDAKSELQQRVNDTYDKFVSQLARNRATTKSYVDENYGQGRIITAEKAVSRGMADRVMSFDQLISRLTGGNSPGVGGQSASSMSSKAEQVRKKWAWMRLRK